MGKIALGAAAMLLSFALHAQERSFDIPAGELKAALDSYITATGHQVLYKDADLKGRVTKGVRGNMTPEQALARLLEGANLKIRKDSSGAVLITADDTKSSAETLESVYVFGNALAHIGDSARTGTRTDVDPMALPMSVSTVDKELLQQQQAISLRDAVSNVAGASQLNSFGVFTMRGFSAGIMRNGNLQTGGEGLDAPQISLSKVEVVKGPEAIIAGINAGYGGTINVISKTPEAKAITEVSGMMGSRGFYEAGLDVNRVVTDDKSLLVRFVAAKQGAGTTLNDYDGSNRRYAAPSVTWRNKPSGTELTASYEYSKARTAPDLTVFTSQTSLGEDLKLYRLAAADAGKVKKNTVATFSASQRINDDWSVAAKYSEDRSDSKNLSPLSGMFPDLGYAFPQVLTFGALLTSKYTTKTSKVELKGHLETGPVEHELLFAYDQTSAAVVSGSQFSTLTSTNVETGAFTDLTPTLGPMFGIPGPYTPFEFKTGEKGALVMDHMTYGNWIALVGWREVRFDPNRMDTSENHRLLKVSLPSLGVVYRATERVSLYANASKGFSPNVGIQNFNGEAIPPEYAQQYEAGIKVQFPQQKMSASLAAFSIKQKNVAVLDPAHMTDICGVAACYISVAGIKSRGFEVETSGEVYKGLGIRANYSFTTRSNDEQDIAGSPYARHQANLWAIYKFGSEFVEQGWWVGAGVQKRSARLGSQDPTVVANPGNTRFDVNVGYQAKAWSVVAGGKNVTNRRIYELGSGIGAQGVVQQPRAFYVTARYSFN
ncbi:TonB-dependent siderophore receptor [Roseateles sp. P5_E11]